MPIAARPLSSPAAPRITAAGAKALDRLLAKTVAADQVPALTFGVASKRGVLYEACAGDMVFRDPAKGKIGPDTILRLHSMTKLVTAIAALQVAERGLVDLDDASVVETHAPELAAMPILEGYTATGAKMRTRTRPMTLRHLITHTAGTTYDFFSAHLGRWRRETGSPSNFAGSVEGFTQPLLFEPGTGYAYGTGLDWAGIVVERVTGLDLEAYFRKHIWQPLGIASMTFRPTTEMEARRQTMFRRKDGVVEPFDGGFNYAAGAQLSGGGGLFGTAADFLRLLSGVLACDEPGGILAPASARELYADQLPPIGEGNTCHADLARSIRKDGLQDLALCADGGKALGWGLGGLVNLVTSQYGRRAGSVSWGGAGKTEFWIDPDAGIAAVMCTQLLGAVVPDDPYPVLYHEFERTMYDALEL